MAQPVEKPSDARADFQRFRHLTEKLLAVPKKEIRKTKSVYTAKRKPRIISPRRKLNSNSK